jgi:hypothetical protein
MKTASSRKGLLVVAGVVIVTLTCAAGWLYRSLLPGTLVLRLHATADGEPLVYNQFGYDNPGGQGRFRVRDFQFFVSNIRLVARDGVHEPTESYHLARFDNPAVSYEIVLDGVPPRDYERVEFALGVDAEANGSLRSVGDLDPNGRMAWSWETGYKFILFEGALEIGERVIPLVYHVGFDENYTPVSFSRGVSIEPLSTSVVDFSVDVLRMFDGEQTIDMATLSNVKFDEDDARLIAGNLTRMITPSEAFRRAPSASTRSRSATR